MDEIICGRSAFRYWRCPPQIRDMYPALPSGAEPWVRLREAPLARDVLGFPFDVLCTRHGSHMDSGLRKSCLWSSDTTPVKTYDSQMGFSVTSPLCTLFTLARFLNFLDLVLVMYEACGWFAVFELPESVREEATRTIREQNENEKTNCPEGLDDIDETPWECIVAKAGKRNGEPTSLWQRAPLIDVAELHSFASKMRPLRWGDKFYRAAMLVRGIAASPLEVQGYLLLSVPRAMGGMGFEDALLNDWTPMSADAMKLCSKRTCYGDIVISNPNTMQTVIVECQGEMIHGTGAIQASDAERVAALQSMGYRVLLVSHEMLNSTEQFRVIGKTVCRECGIRFRPKTARQTTMESELRSSVFCDWAALV